MTIINSIQINNSGTEIFSDVSVNPLYRLDKVFFWDYQTFKDQDKAVDLSFLLRRELGGETLTILPSHVGLEKFESLYFLEFITTENSSQILPTNRILGVAANLVKYWSCLLEKVVNIDIKNCGNCTETSDIYYHNTVLNTLSRSILSGSFDKAIQFICTLDSFCMDVCKECLPTNTYLTNGVNYGIENNKIVYK